MRQQLLTANRHLDRSPPLTPFERVLYGFLSKFISRDRLNKVAITIKPATIFGFHQALVNRKYSKIFGAQEKGSTCITPGRKSPDPRLKNLVIEYKKRNPYAGYLRISMQVFVAFHILISPESVGRILRKHFDENGPYNKNGKSWLSFIGNMKDSLWSVDLFRCESINLKSHWVMIVMDQYTRRIIGFAVHQGDCSGKDYCRMFNKIISKSFPPKYLSSDNDPLFRYFQWGANLRIEEIDPIKSIAYVPISHPFIERVIGTVRREYLDHTLFFNERDLQKKLNGFQAYYNSTRGHSSLGGKTPTKMGNDEKNPRKVASLDNYRWEKHCRGLFEVPIAV